MKTNTPETDAEVARLNALCHAIGRGTAFVEMAYHSRKMECERNEEMGFRSEWCDRARKATAEVERLEAECARLHALWHSAEEMLNVEKADSLRSAMVEICATMTGHCPRELCTTAEAVRWLVDRHKAATAALYKLEEIRTEKLAVNGLPAEASAVSAARVILQSKRIADETSGRSAYNAKCPSTGEKGTKCTQR